MKFSLTAILLGFLALSVSAQPQSPQAIISELTGPLLDRASRAFLRRAYQDAIRDTSKVLEVDPKNLRARLLRGQVYEEVREHELAIADFTEVIKQAPEAIVYQHRGFEYFKLGKIKEALADFDKFIELAPAQAAHHWQRGIALYYAGQFEDGRKQFELHQTVNAQDVENAVWHFLCAARTSGTEKARASLIEIKGDPRVPMAQIHALFAGSGSTKEVLAAAEAGQPAAEALKSRLFYAHLYLALYHEAHGNAKLAEEHLVKATGPYAQDHYMGDVARVHLKLLRSRGAKS